MLCGGKNKLRGIVDVAVMQTLAGKDNLPELLDHYEQSIVDECHLLDGQAVG